MYVKLFTSIYQGTLRGNSHGLLVFTNLLAHCDKDGIVDIHPRAIAEEVGLTIEEVKETLLMLESPDDESRSPDEQGRRIIRLDEHRAWGWFVVNYEKYRKIRNEDDRREQNRSAQRNYRKKSKLTVSKVSQASAMSAHADVEAEAEAYIKPKNTLHQKTDEDARFDEFWEAYPRKVGKKESVKAFKSVVTSEYTFQALMAGLANWVGSREWKEDQQFIPHPATFIRKERFMDMPVMIQQKKANGNWRSSNVGIEAKGNELGMRALGGESWAAFADRIQQRLDSQ